MEGVIGYATLFAGNFAPKNWAFCSGQIINIASNTALFSILGTVYGGNGTSTFGLPNLQGRAVVGAGQGPGLSPYSLGETTGVESVVLNSTNLATHVHPVQVTITPPAATAATAETPIAGVYSNNTEQLYNPTADSSFKTYTGTLTVAPTGNGLPLPTLHPVLGLSYIICMFGVFPARN